MGQGRAESNQLANSSRCSACSACMLVLKLTVWQRVLEFAQGGVRPAGFATGRAGSSRLQLARACEPSPAPRVCRAARPAARSASQTPPLQARPGHAPASQIESSSRRRRHAITCSGTHTSSAHAIPKLMRVCNGCCPLPRRDPTCGRERDLLPRQRLPVRRVQQRAVAHIVSAVDGGVAARRAGTQRG